MLTTAGLTLEAQINACAASQDKVLLLLILSVLKKAVAVALIQQMARIE